MPAHEDILLVLVVARMKCDQEIVEKKDIGGMAKIKGASTIRNALKKLKDLKFIEYIGTAVKVTDLGMGSVDKSKLPNIKIPTSNEEYHNEKRSELKASEIPLYDKLLDGLPHNKEELRKELGREKNSTWRNMLAKFKREKIAEYPDNKTIRATKKMFPVVPRPSED